MPNETADPMILLDEIHMTYRTGEVETHVLRGISGSVQRGEFVTIFGPSGCGKTTLLNLIGGLDAPTSGQIVVDGESISGRDSAALTTYRREKLGFIFQFYNLIPTLTALENVEVALAFKAFPGDQRQARREQAQRYLEMVELSGKEENFPSQLSGGEQQRVAVARALAREPALVLADEPTGNLDTKTGNRVFELFRELQRTLSVTCAMVTHNRKLAEQTDRIITLHEGRLA